MSGEPKTLTPQAMTLEEGLAAIFPDTIGRRDDGKWPFFTYVNDEHGHTCTAIFDSWPEAVSWAKGVPVVARDDAAELRAAAADAAALLKRIDDWEGTVILADEVWATSDGMPKLTRELYDQWIELQDERNRVRAALAATEGQP